MNDDTDNSSSLPQIEMIERSRSVKYDDSNVENLRQALDHSIVSKIANKLWRIKNYLKDTILWEYNSDYETENEKIYREYEDEDELPLIVEQKIIPARSINMDDCAVTEKDYPWHKRSFEEFASLNRELQECIILIAGIKTSKDVKRFRLKHRNIYDVYLRRPISITKDENGRYFFGWDGRHRIHVASIDDGYIPVWVIEYKKKSQIEIEYFRNHFPQGGWRFLGGVE